MKRALLAAVCLVLQTSPALAAERYASLSAGAWFPGHTTAVDFNFRPIDVTYNPGWSLGGAAGVAYDNGFRLEN